MMKSFLSFLGLWLLLGPWAIQAQPGAAWWQPVNQAAVPTGTPTQEVTQFQSYQLDVQALNNWLSQAPMEQMQGGSRLSIQLPHPEGGFARFQVVKTPVLAPALAARYPDIQTFVGQSMDNPATSIRCDLTEFGFHAMVVGPDETYFIEPSHLQTNTFYRVFLGRHVLREGSLGCGLTEDHVPGLTDFLTEESAHTHAHTHSDTHTSAERGQSLFESGDQLYTYNLAVSADFRYCNAATAGNPTVAGVLAQLATTLNQVNGIYEREASIRFILNANNDQLIFLNQATDPFFIAGSSGDPSQMITDNPGIIDSRIGINTYDIGHAVTSISFGGSAGAAGVGYFRSVCTSGSGQFLSNPHRANGSSAGQPSPVNTQFLETILHELGHQFNGRHSFNTNDATCLGPRDPTRPFEPASGSTIMSYAGLCGLNLQQDPDLYFNTGSYELIHEFSRNFTPCLESLTNTNNTAPQITDKGITNTVLPIETAFELTAVATDAEDVGLTYCWEQADIGPAGNPNTPSGNAPIFRSFPPTSNPTRTFPTINSVLNGTTVFGEAYPTYTRDLNFRITVRDNHPGSGGVSYEEVSFDVTDDAGPFLVLEPNGGETLTGGRAVDITWDPAGTDLSPVDCDAVDVYLSTDGGFNANILLASQTPNDGSVEVFMPDLPGVANRVKIKASNNVFFDVSNGNFSIETASQPDLGLLSSIDTAFLCPGGSSTFFLYTSSIGGFAGDVTVSVTGFPPEVGVSTSPAQPMAGDTIEVTLTAGPGVVEGEQPFVVSASGTGVSESLILRAKIEGELPGTPEIAAPLTGAANQSRRPTFNWQAASGAVSYRFELASDPSFTGAALVEVDNDVMGLAYSPGITLDPEAVYYWRVAANSSCGTGAFSRLGAVQTSACENYQPTDLPQTIPQFGFPQVVNSSVTVPAGGTISSLSVQQVQGTHQAVNQLSFSLRKTGGTSVVLLNRPCPLGGENFNLSFADQTTPVFPPCPPTDGGVYQPLEPLGAFNGTAAGGTYSLRIIDSVNFDGGQFDNWELEVCLTGGAALTVANNDTLFLLAGEERTIDNTLLNVTSPVSGASDVSFTVAQLPSYGTLKLNGQTLALGDGFTQADVDGNLLSYEQDGTAQPFDEFLYSVLDANNGWAGLQTFPIRVTDVTSIRQVANEGLQVYPNPVRDILTVLLPREHVNNRVLLFSQQGQVVRQQMSQGQADVQVNVAGLAKGLYLLQVQADGLTWTEKVQVD